MWPAATRNPFARSLARSLAHTLTFFHPHINPLTRSHTAHPLTRLQTPFTRSLARSLTHSLFSTHTSIHSLTHSLFSVFFFFFQPTVLKVVFFKKSFGLDCLLDGIQYYLRRQYRWSNWSSHVLTCKVVVKISVRIGAIRSTVWSSCLSPHTILKWVKVDYLQLETCMPI